MATSFLALAVLAVLGQSSPLARATDACGSGTCETPRAAFTAAWRGGAMLQKTVQSSLPRDVEHHATRSPLILARQKRSRARSLARRNSAQTTREAAMLYKAHSVALRTKKERMQRSLSKADDEINTMIDDFVNGQSESEDHCSAQLYQAQKELHNLHKHTMELVDEVHVLEAEISNQSEDLTELYEQEAEVHEWEDAQLEVCYEESEEDKEMYAILELEMLELMQIANASVSISSDRWSTYRENVTNRTEEYAKVNVTVSNVTMSFTCYPSTGAFNCTGPEAYCSDKKDYCDEVYQDHVTTRDYDCDIENGDFRCIGDDAWCYERQQECQAEFDAYNEEQGEKSFKCDLTDGSYSFTCKGDDTFCNYHEQHCKDMYEAGSTGWASDDTNWTGNTGYLGDECAEDAYICDTETLQFQCVTGCCWDHFDSLSEQCTQMLGLGSLLELGAKPKKLTHPAESLVFLQMDGHSHAKADHGELYKKRNRFASHAQSTSLMGQKVRQKVAQLQMCFGAYAKHKKEMAAAGKRHLQAAAKQLQEAKRSYRTATHRRAQPNRHPMGAFLPPHAAMLQLGARAAAHGGHGLVGRSAARQTPDGAASTTPAPASTSLPRATGSTTARTTTTAAPTAAAADDESHLHGYCTDGVPATVGNMTGIVELDRFLLVGEFGTYPCADINPHYTGIVVATCMQESMPVKIDTSTCIEVGHQNQTAECSIHIAELHEVYVKAYVEITRLLAYYSSYNTSVACVDAVESEYSGKEEPIEQTVTITRAEISAEQRKLEAYKIELELIVEAENKLRSHIAMLEVKCDAMHTTVSSLEEVRDSIAIVGTCPGFGDVAFYVPKYMCTLPPRDIDLLAYTDEDLDDMLDGFCKAECSQESRPAEVAEIMEETIEGMPKTNIAGVPVLGTCPFCDGLVDSAETKDKHASGHRRVCWDGGVEFGKEFMRTDCTGATSKTVVCLMDHGAEFEDTFGVPTEAADSTANSTTE